MDPGNIPFNALIVGPTNSGKTHFLVNQLCGPFQGKFDYIVLICPTFAHNRTLYRFAERDPCVYVIICEQHHVENWLKVACFYFEGDNTLIILDDCASSKDVKDRTGELVKLAFSARHVGISVWVLAQQLSTARILSERIWRQSFSFTRRRRKLQRQSSKNTAAAIHTKKSIR